MSNIHDANLVWLSKLRIIGHPAVDDYKQVKLTWRQRLLSWPWRPWLASKTIKSPKAFIMADGSVVVSTETKAYLDEKLFSLDDLKQKYNN